MRKPCAQGLRRVVHTCARSVEWLCAGIVRRLVRNGCALVVRTQGAKSCAHATAQGFCLVQDSTFRAAQGCEPCAEFDLIEFKRVFPASPIIKNADMKLIYDVCS